MMLGPIGLYGYVATSCLYDYLVIEVAIYISSRSGQEGKSIDRCGMKLDSFGK